MKEQDEIWTAAYSISAAAITIGVAVSSRVIEPDNIDALARELADRAVKTIEERAGKKRGKG